MSDIRLIYIILKLILFVTLYISGRYLSKVSEDKYWKVAVVPILVFSCVVGLRFGRMVDYNVYYFRYIDINVLNDEFEPLFVFIVKLFRFFDLSYPVFVFFCSSLLIYSFLFLIKPFRVGAMFVLPIILTLNGIENYIRWYLALSFIFLGVGYWFRTQKVAINRNYYLSFLFCFASFFIHQGAFVVVILLFLFYFFLNRLYINRWLILVAFVVTLFWGNTESFSEVVSKINIFSSLSGSERLENYSSNLADIAAGGMKTGVLYEKTMFGNLRTFFAFIPILFIGYKYRFDKNLNICWLYNFFSFSIIVYPIFMLVEIFNRISASLMFFSVIYIGLILKQMCLSKTWMILLFYLSIFCLYYPYFKDLLLISSDNQMMFIWDANGRNYLNY